MTARRDRLLTFSKRCGPSPRIRYKATVKQQSTFSPLCTPRRLRVHAAVYADISSQISSSSILVPPVTSRRSRRQKTSSQSLGDRSALNKQARRSSIVTKLGVYRHSCIRGSVIHSFAFKSSVAQCSRSKMSQLGEERPSCYPPLDKRK